MSQTSNSHPLDYLRDVLEAPNFRVTAERALEAIRERNEYKKALEDLAAHGTRHDLNPTMNYASMGTLSSGFTSYIHSMDEAVRERAQVALDEIQRRRTT